MTIPGVDMVVALAIVAAIGEVGRFEQSQNLVSYLGLNPSVRQSGPGPAYHGRITKQGRAHARGMLVEAAWAAARAPGPLRACVSACNFGSDAISMTWPLSQAHDAGLEEVEVSATVHLTFDELQLADLAFGLPVGPLQGDCRLDRGFVFGHAAGECRDEAGLGSADPGLQVCKGLSSNDPWNSRIISRASTRTVTPFSMAATVIVSALDSCSRPTVRRRATVRADGARAKCSWIRLLGLFSSRAPFAHDAKTASESVQPEFPP
jgi:hypothetical protein